MNFYFMEFCCWFLLFYFVYRKKSTLLSALIFYLRANSRASSVEVGCLPKFGFSTFTGLFCNVALALAIASSVEVGGSLWNCLSSLGCNVLCGLFTSLICWSNHIFYFLWHFYFKMWTKSHINFLIIL